MTRQKERSPAPTASAPGKDYLKYTRCRKHTAKMTRKAIGKQLSYLKRDLEAIDGKLLLGKSLTDRQMERLNTLRTNLPAAEVHV